MPRDLEWPKYRHWKGRKRLKKKKLRRGRDVFLAKVNKEVEDYLFGRRSYNTLDGIAWELGCKLNEAEDRGYLVPDHSGLIVSPNIYRVLLTKEPDEPKGQNR